jgi:peptidoglycan/xylan/chitin deacetylase (PgdA/CDA1 family)
MIIPEDNLYLDRNARQNQAPVLITWDVDPDRWTILERRLGVLSKTLDLCDEFGIRSTFFVTANFAHEYLSLTRRMQESGHEIGCHGLTHTDEEDYDRMPAGMQRTYIKEATRKLEDLVGAPITTFRSPRVKTSAQTLGLLAELGYCADSSVCSQRVDFVSSNLINLGWLVAPRRPYHPHSANAFRRGALAIWEVPVSATIIPFISSSLKVMGSRYMKVFFRLLYAESRYTGKPIVYLAHPSEFLDVYRRRAPLAFKDFSPRRVRTHGLLARKAFYRLMGPALFDATRELFAYGTSLPGVTFMTCKAYIRYLNQAAYKGAA